jgi:hypothetical protein
MRPVRGFQMEDRLAFPALIFRMNRIEQRISNQQSADHQSGTSFCSSVQCKRMELIGGWRLLIADLVDRVFKEARTPRSWSFVPRAKESRA